MLLPTQKTKPRDDLSDYSILLHARPKVGKSSWCAQAEGVLFLATEPGLNALEVYQIPIDNWEKMAEALAEIVAGNHSFKTIVIDTIDNAYILCAKYICEQAGVAHESELPYGSGYAAINLEFRRVLTKLAGMPYGLYLISHSQEKEIDSRTGKYMRVIPTLPDKASKIVLGLVDMILYCDLELAKDGEGKQVVRRVMRTKPSIYYEAGDRTGRLPEVIDLDYGTFLKAFAAGKDRKPENNKTTNTQKK